VIEENNGACFSITHQFQIVKNFQIAIEILHFSIFALLLIAYVYFFHLWIYVSTICLWVP